MKRETFEKKNEEGSAYMQDHYPTMEEREWWTLKQCCIRKGLQYKTACNRRYLQPNRGKADGKVGGRKVWRVSTVIEWLPQTDEELMKGADNE